jgi:hypothetical protein
MCRGLTRGSQPFAIAAHEDAIKGEIPERDIVLFMCGHGEGLLPRKLSTYCYYVYDVLVLGAHRSFYHRTQRPVSETRRMGNKKSDRWNRIRLIFFTWADRLLKKKNPEPDDLGIFFFVFQKLS